jgi:hypothetical protein
VKSNKGSLLGFRRCKTLYFRPVPNRSLKAVGFDLCIHQCRKWAVTMLSERRDIEIAGPCVCVIFTTNPFSGGYLFSRP